MTYEKKILQKDMRIHLTRALWLSRILIHVNPKSKLAQNLADWFCGAYPYARKGAGHIWLNVTVPDKFPMTEDRYGRTNSEGTFTADQQSHNAMRKEQRRVHRFTLLKEIVDKSIGKKNKQREETPTEQNINMFSQKIGLSDLETQVILCLADYKSQSGEASPISVIRGHSDYNDDFSSIAKTIAIMLDADEKAIEEIISPRGRLSIAGIIQPKVLNDEQIQFSYADSTGDISLSKFFIALINRPIIDENNLERAVFGTPVTTRLQKSDYDYMAADRDVLISFVKAIRDDAWKHSGFMGLYGEPGIGKSQLAGVIAQESELPFYYLGTSKANEREGQKPHDDEMTRKEIFAELRFKNLFAQKIGAKVGFVLEEADGALRQKNTEKSDEASKGHVNETLENTRCPVIIITNSLEALERSTIRRILPVIGMSTPPDGVVVSLIERMAKAYDLPFDRDKMIDLMIKYHGLSIGEIERVAAYTFIAVKDDPEKLWSQFEHNIESALTALQGGLQMPRARTYVPANFNIGLLHTSHDVSHIQSAFKRAIAARHNPKIMLYGLAGTGKRTLATHLFEQANLRVMECPFSELIGLGGYEELISIFREAAATRKGVLITRAEVFYLQKDVNTNFANVRIMMEAGTPVIFTADLQHQDHDFSYSYDSSLKETDKKPWAVTVTSQIAHEYKPPHLAQGFDAVIECKSLTRTHLNAAFTALFQEPMPQTLAHGIQAPITIGDLVAVKQQVDFMLPPDTLRAAFAAQVLANLKAPFSSHTGKPPHNPDASDAVLQIGQQTQMPKPHKN